MVLFFSTSAFGQRIAYGIELGGIVSRDMRFELRNAQNYRYTYFAGTNVLVSPGNKVGYITGIHYLRQGYQHSTCYLVEPGTNSNLIGKVDQIAIPFGIRGSLFKSNRFFGELGLYGAYNIKAFADVPVAIGGCEIGYVSDLRPMTQPWSLGSMVGLEYVISTNHRKEFGVNLRYYQGLSNSAKSTFVNLNTKPIQRRSSLALNLFIRFDAYNEGK